jgi:apolipoprotein N-acyltransferase
MVWIGLVGFAYALDLGSVAGRLEGARRGVAFGFAANLLGVRFVPMVIARFTPLPYAVGVVALLLLAAAQGLPWGVAAVARSALVRARVPRPVGFALGIYAATFVPCVFPWTPAGAVSPWPSLLQLAELIGERGVTGVIALSAGLLAAGLRVALGRGSLRRSVGFVALGLALPLAMTVEGRVRMAAIDARRQAAPSVTLGLVDARIPATTRWDPEAATGILQSLGTLTEGAERRGADLVVWPEGAYPYVLPRGERSSPVGEGSFLQPGVRGPLIAGGVTRSASGDEFNSAFVVSPRGTIDGEYDKLHLLWFGEEVPLATELPWIRRTFARGLGMLPGDHPVRLDAGKAKTSPLICFEDLLPEAGRDAMSVSPNLLVNISNDAWFSGSFEPSLHARLSVVRAVEARRDLVRAVNIGPTGLIDAAGRTHALEDADFPNAVVVQAALLTDPPTLYSRFGDAPWLFAGTLVALGCWLRRRATGIAKTERAPDHVRDPTLEAGFHRAPRIELRAS